MAGKHKAPARGALAGIKEDMKRAAAGEYNPAPAGVGTAWSHNFLNQKPWHPLNFRNQAKVFEAEQAAAKEAKAKAQSKAEFEQEQEYLQTLSYLSEADRKAYSDRQSVSFMYQKPPGLDAALSRDGVPPESRPGASGAAPVAPAASAAHSGGMPDAEAGAPGAPGEAGLGGGLGPGGPAQGQLPARASASDKKYIANMLGAVSALQEHEKWEVKHMHGGGQRSPPRGGADPAAANQQLLVDSDSGASGDGGARSDASGAHPFMLVAGYQKGCIPQATEQSIPACAAEGDEAQLNKRRKLDQLEQAEAFLRAAGLDPSALKEGAGKKHRKKDKKDKHKHKHRRKHKP